MITDENCRFGGGGGVAPTLTLHQREREKNYLTSTSPARGEVAIKAKRSDGPADSHPLAVPEAQGVGRARQRSMPRFVL